MGKLSFIFKLFPLLIMLQGVGMGIYQFKMMINMGKRVFTQYELSKITELVLEDFQKRGNSLMPKSDFPSFVRKNYDNQISALVRRVFDKENTDYANDIWGNPYQMIFDEKVGLLSLTSLGKDKRAQSIDDVTVHFNLPVTRKQETQKEEPSRMKKRLLTDEQNDHQADDEHDRYDDESDNRDQEMDYRNQDRERDNQDRYRYEEESQSQPEQETEEFVDENYKEDE